MSQDLKLRHVEVTDAMRDTIIDLLDKIEVNQNYSKSDTLQVMRILKNYDLLRETQLDLTVGKRPRMKQPKLPDGE